MKTEIIRINPRQPEIEKVRRAALSLLEGKLVAFPTETVYGVGVCANHQAALERLRTLKNRPTQKKFSYHIGELGAIEKLGIRNSSVLRFFCKQFWPGPVTLVIWNDKEERVGLRFPKHEVATRLIQHCGQPFLATSANFGGEVSPKNAQDVIRALDGHVDILLDGGPCQYAEDSTVVDLTVSPPRVLRRGARINDVLEAIQRVERGKFPRKKILVVCTGNTCRSPMAEAWLRAELKKKGLHEQIEVSSCGIMARDGGSVTMEVELVLKNDEVPLGHFRSHTCRREEVLASDLIVTMTAQHEQFIASLCPTAAERIVTLEVSDPIGLSVEAYEQSYQDIKTKLSRLWERIVK